MPFFGGNDFHAKKSIEQNDAISPNLLKEGKFFGGLPYYPYPVGLVFVDLASQN